MNASVIAIADETSPPMAAGEVCAPQVGALCWRRHGKGIQVLLITSRETGRWVIPKGGIAPGREAAASAMLEAWEEAGVEGHLSTDATLGSFGYDKLFRKRHESQRCEVQVFPLRVDRLHARFPEKGQRRRKWFKPAKAAAQVMEPALRALLMALADDAGPLTLGPAAATTP